MAIVARMLTQEEDGIPGYAAYAEGKGPHPGVLMVHHAHGVTADYKIDAYRLAGLGCILCSRCGVYAFKVEEVHHNCPSSKNSSRSSSSCTTRPDSLCRVAVRRNARRELTAVTAAPASVSLISVDMDVCGVEG